MRVTRVLREVVKQAWTPKEMHKLLGSTDDSSVEQLRELYLVRVREIHPDTAGPDAGDIEIHELKDIYDKLIERRIESETSVHGQRQVPWTVEDYRAGRHKSKATLTHYFYSNAFRFWIMIPMMIIMTEMSYDIVTDVKGRKQKAVSDREDRLYMQALAEYRADQKPEPA